MAIEHPAENVVRHLIDELGERGQRAAEFLSTARTLLDVGLDSAPRMPESFVFCLREATTSIIQIPRNAGRADTRGIVAPVLQALDEVEASVDDAGRDAALDILRDRLPSLRQLLQSWVERDLIEGLIERTGAVAPAMHAELVAELQDIRGGLNSGVHNSIGEAEALDLYDRLCIVLRRLFTPPTVRDPELRRLAELPTPTADDLAALRALLVSPQHMRTFLQSLTSPTWLDVLRDEALFDPPEDGGPWAGYAAADALAASHAPRLVVWFEAMYDRCRANPLQALPILRALQDVGRDSHELILRIVREHITTKQIREQVWALVAHLDPASALVENLADLLLNDHQDDSWLVDEVAARVVAGVTPDNALSRLRLLAYKLRRDGGSSALTFGLQRAGRLDDLQLREQHERHLIILAAFVSAMLAANGAVPHDEVLAIVDMLDEDTRSRVRAWWLGQSDESTVPEMVDEITAAIATREPTGDDLTLIERIGSGVDTGAWSDALGPAPVVDSLDDLFEGYSEDRSRCIRAYRWLGLLPAGIAGPWAEIWSWMVARYGAPTPESYTNPFRTTVLSGRSPFSRPELEALEVPEAAAKIAAWRPDPNDSMTGSGELAQTLQELIASSPSGWLADPVATATALREPTYITAYLRGTTQAIKADAEYASEKLVDVVDLALSQPWEPSAIGRRGWGEDGWDSCLDAALWLLQAMCVRGIEDESVRDRVWQIIEDILRGPRALREALDDDPMTASFASRPNALRTVLMLMSLDATSGRAPRLDALGLLSDALNEQDPSARGFRAVLAGSLEFLHSVVPEWLDAHEDRIFAPTGHLDLGIATIETALLGSRPGKWFMERRATDVFDAVRRGARQALDHLVIAHLLGFEGYRLDRILGLLGTERELTNQLGEALGRVLDNAEDATVIARAVQLWKAVLAVGTSEQLAGFGWLFEAKGIDDATWLTLTLATARRSTGGLDRASHVAERASAMPPSEETLALLDVLVRHPRIGWASLRVHEVAARHLTDAATLSDTTAYRRLAAALAERGLTP